MAKDAPWPVTREDIADFCSAVLADNMPRHDEPWRTIAYYINAGRKRAYRMGREDGAKYGPLADAPTPSSPSDQPHDR